MGTVGAGVAGAGIGGIAGGLAGSSLGNRQGSFGSNTAGGFGSNTAGGFGSHSNTGFGSHSNTGFGSHSNTGFGSHSNTGFGSHSNTGFGGFGSHTQSSHSGSRSGLGGMLGAGAAGAMGGGLLGGGLSHVLRPNRYGTNQYQSFSKPSLGQRLGQRLFGSSRKPYGYNTPGHGTSFGTNFAGGVGRFKPSGGISKKMLGLGVGAGFLGGAALGVAGTMASYSVYHKYQEFKRRMHMLRPSFGFNEEYYRDNYQRNECQYGCPFNSHCEWGFCECNAGTTRRYGQCQADWSSVPNFTPRPTTFDPFQPCSSTSTCATMDMNLICNTALTTGQGGRCECRQDMKWNEQEGECQMYLDVDCSQFTYDTPPSANILSAVSRAQANMETNPVDIVDASAEGRTQTYQESLQNSLLQQMDTTQSTEADLREAFCRDIDAYSFEMEPRALPGPNLPGPTTRSSVQVQLMTVRPTLPPMQQAIGKPPRCEHVPRTACAVAYDSHNCDGGWRLVIPVGEMRFRWFTSTYTYRNDIDTIGVRAGCVFTGYSDSSYNGNRMTMRADSQDRWSVLADEPAFQHMDEDIESVQCTCPNMG